MRQAGRYLPEYREVRAGAGNFLDLCYNPDLAAEVTLQPVRRFSLDAAIVFSDILVIPHALGQRVDFREGVGPVLDPIQSSHDVAALHTSGLRDHLLPVYQTLSRVKAALPERVALIGFAGAPWTIATYMIEGGSSRDYAKTKSWAFGDPATFQELVAVLEEAVADHLIAQVDAGAEVLIHRQQMIPYNRAMTLPLCIRPVLGIICCRCIKPFHASRPLCLNASP